MSESAMILFPIFFPIAAGVLLLIGKEPKRKHSPAVFTGAALVITALLVLGVLCGGDISFTLFFLTGRLPVYFRLDSVGRVFAGIVTIVWLLSGFFSFVYMKEDKAAKRFYGFYLVVYGVLVALDFSGNLITLSSLK